MSAVPEVVVAAAIGAHLFAAATRTWPEECCGALLGEMSADGRFRVTGIAELANSSAGDRRTGFAIAPADLAACVARVGVDAVLGFYHSHPVGPAVPSPRDLAQASPWPGYLQAIVVPGATEEITFFVVKPDGWHAVVAKRSVDG